MSKKKDEIKKEVLEFLDIRDADALSDVQLFKLLDKKRKKIHPDKTTDDDVKKEFEEKIKVANELYVKFGKHIKGEQEDFSIQLYNNEQSIVAVDFINVKFENDELRLENEKLKTEIEQLKADISRKDKVITALNDKRVQEETEKLKEYFKPKKTNMIILGVVAILGILTSILLKAEEVIGIITKYVPDSFQNITNIVTILILLVIVLVFVFSYIKKIIINNWIENVNSTEFYNNLFDFISANDNHTASWDSTYSFKTNTFKEIVIYNFLKERFIPKSKFEKIIQKVIGLNYFTVFENLKNIAIYQLINKGIIKIKGKSGFDIKFDYSD